MFDSRPRKDDLLMLLKVYIDDSADQQQQEVVLAGAFIGRFGQWSRVKTKWRRALKRENIGYFKSSEYKVLDGEFRKYRDPVKYPKPHGSVAAKALRDELESIVCKGGIVGWGMCLSMPDWHRARNSDKHGPAILDRPFEIVVQKLLLDLSESVTQLMGDGHGLTFIADESSSSERMEKVYLDFKRVNKSLENIVGFTHLDDKKTPPLQVADMMAGVAKECYEDFLKSGGEIIPKRLKDVIMRIRVIDEAYLLAIIEHEKTRRGLS